MRFQVQILTFFVIELLSLASTRTIPKFITVEEQELQKLSKHKTPEQYMHHYDTSNMILTEEFLRTHNVKYDDNKPVRKKAFKTIPSKHVTTISNKNGDKHIKKQFSSKDKNIYHKKKAFRKHLSTTQSFTTTDPHHGQNINQAFSESLDANAYPILISNNRHLQGRGRQNQRSSEYPSGQPSSSGHYPPSSHSQTSSQSKPSIKSPLSVHSKPSIQSPLSIHPPPSIHSTTLGQTPISTPSSVAQSPLTTVPSSTTNVSMTENTRTISDTKLEPAHSRLNGGSLSSSLSLYVTGKRLLASGSPDSANATSKETTASLTHVMNDTNNGTVNIDSDLNKNMKKDEKISRVSKTIDVVTTDKNKEDVGKGPNVGITRGGGNDETDVPNTSTKGELRIAVDVEKTQGELGHTGKTTAGKQNMTNVNLTTAGKQNMINVNLTTAGNNEVNQESAMHVDIPQNMAEQRTLAGLNNTQDEVVTVTDKNATLVQQGISGDVNSTQETSEHNNEGELVIDYFNTGVGVSPLDDEQLTEDSGELNTTTDATEENKQVDANEYIGDRNVPLGATEIQEQITVIDVSTTDKNNTMDLENTTDQSMVTYDEMSTPIPTSIHTTEPQHTTNTKEQINQTTWKTSQQEVPSLTENTTEEILQPTNSTATNDLSEKIDEDNTTEENTTVNPPDPVDASTPGTVTNIADDMVISTRHHNSDTDVLQHADVQATTDNMTTTTNQTYVSAADEQDDVIMLHQNKLQSIPSATDPPVQDNAATPSLSVIHMMSHALAALAGDQHNPSTNGEIISTEIQKTYLQTPASTASTPTTSRTTTSTTTTTTSTTTMMHTTKTTATIAPKVVDDAFCKIVCLMSQTCPPSCGGRPRVWSR